MKSIVDSATEQTHLIRYQHLNGQRRLFGGQLLQWIDELAGTVAIRHCGGEVSTVAVDNLIFKAPALLGDLVVMHGCITFIGNTSMEVRVDSYRECPGGERDLINRVYLVMVSLDEEGRPRPIPPLEPTGVDECFEWAQGEKRYALRRRRREENY